MTYDELVALVGSDRYRAACDCAWRLLRGESWPDGLDMVPHDLADPWDAYREALDSPDDRLAEPMAYSLWVDYFEARATVQEAWREMLHEPTDRRLERLLHASGPVPWRLKQPLFEQLFRTPRWHPFIRLALDAAETDVFGQSDRQAAATWRRRLDP